MKNLLIILLIGIATLVIAGPPNVTSVSTTSIKIIPAQGFNSAPAWVGATNTYVQGEVCENDGNYYMAVIGGISTNLAPIHSLGTADTARDGVTWRVFSRKRRRGFAAINTATNILSLSIGYPAISGSGIVLAAGGADGNGGGAFSLNGDDCPQDAVYAIYNTGSNNVSHNDW